MAGVKAQVSGKASGFAQREFASFTDRSGRTVDGGVVATFYLWDAEAGEMHEVRVKDAALRSAFAAVPHGAVVTVAVELRAYDRRTQLQALAAPQVAR